MSNNLQAIHGHAVHQLSEILSSADFPLLTYLSPDMHPAFFDTLHFTDPVVFRDGNNTVTNLILLYEGDIQLKLPTTDAFRFLIGGTGSGWSHVATSVAIGTDPSLIIRDFTVALELTNAILQDVQTGEPAAIYMAADIGFSSTGISFNNVIGATLNPAYLLGTGIVISATHILPRFDPMTLSVDTLEEVSFLGVDIHQMQMTLPLDFLTLPGNSSITFQLDSVAISERGFTGRVSLQGEELNLQDGGMFKELPARPREIGIDIFENQFVKFFAGFDLRLAFLETTTVENWIAVDFGLGASKIAKARLLAPIQFDIRGADFKLTIDSFEATGVWSNAGIAFDGQASGQLKLDQFDLALGQTTFHFDHTELADNIKCGLENLNLGPLGQVSKAEFHLQLKANTADERVLHDFFVLADFQWSDLSARLSLTELPDFVPVPPDDALVHASVRWFEEQGNETIEIEFSVATTDPSSLWNFVPAQFQPEIGQTMLQFRIRYASPSEFDNATTTDSFAANIAIQTQVRLPTLNQLINLDFLEVSTGDEDGWIVATARTRIEQNATGNNEAHLDFELANAIAMAVQIPGLPQDEAPIAIQITSIDLEMGYSTATTGKMKLAGNFQLRPVQPPVFLPLAATIKKLLEPITAAELGGTATAELEFKDDKASFSLACNFDQAEIEIDLFDMIAGLASGIPSAEGLNGQTNTIDLDLEIGFYLRRIALQFGSLMDNSNSQISFSLQMGLSVLGVHTDFEFLISDQQIAFGFTELAIPIKIPAMPMHMDDLNQLRGAGGHWNKQKWLDEIEPEIVVALGNLTQEINGFQFQILVLEQELENLETSPERSLKQAELKRLKEREIPKANEQSLHLSAKRFLLDAIMLLHDLMSAPANRTAFQQFVEAYQFVVDKTLGSIHLDTQLLFVLSNVKFVLPFDNPSDIRVEGSANIAGFDPSDPFAPLGELIFKLGLSAEYIYFSVEGGGNPIPLPDFGRYKGGNIDLKHIRIAYGYSKNSFAVAFAGAIKLPEALVEDADISNVIGAGLRLPVQSRLAFNLDLIPVVLGEVDFVIPLLKFDLDLRQENTPGLIDSRTCTPAWDGLQLIVPNVMRLGFKKATFSPFYGPIPAPNFNTSYDIHIGNQAGGVTIVCDNYLVITPVMGQLPVPFIADATPYFDNLCMNVSIAGFGVNFNLQRPFPQVSPMAIFEVMGLFADPGMPIDPNGALANTMRATIEHAFISLPPYLVRMFPELGNVVEREVNYTLNLGTVMTLAQTVTPWLEQILAQADASAANAQQLVLDVIANPPNLSPSKVLAMLPPTLRCLHFEGSFGGFDASTVVVLMTQSEAYAEFDRRDKPPVAEALITVFEDAFQDTKMTAWKVFNQGHRRPDWTVKNGQLVQTSNTYKNETPLRPGTFVVAKNVTVSEHLVLNGVLRSKDGGIGVMFAIENENTYYRFAIYDQQYFELLKVKGRNPKILFSKDSNADHASRFHVAIEVKPASVLSPTRGRASLRANRNRAGGLSIRIHVNGKLWCNVIDRSAPITKGSFGLYSWKNTNARFENLQVHTQSEAETLAAGTAASPAAAFALQPNFQDHGRPLFDPNAVENNVFAHSAFEGFDAVVLDSIESPSPDAVGVIAAARVNLFDQQIYRFLGVIFSDGRFSLVSEIGIDPLTLRVAGITLRIPLSFQGRLLLSGQSQGALTHASITAQALADWDVFPGVLRLRADSAANPMALQLHSDGRFAISGSGSAEFFGGVATLQGQLDISETHCFLHGEFIYQPNFYVGGKRVLALYVDSTGRIGPGPHFEFSGIGKISILGQNAAVVTGKVSDHEIQLATTLELPKLHGLPIDMLRLELQGAIAFNNSPVPDFLLEGKASFKGFKAGNNSALEIHGVGGLLSKNGEVTTYIGGRLRWQGRDWLSGRIEVGTQGVSVEGSTSFALDLLDLPDNLNTQFASLYFSIEVSGRFGLNKAGRLTECGLQTQWVLAIKLPGADQQLLPVAMQAIDLNVNNLSDSNQLIKLVELLKFDSLSVLPVDGITIPVPQLIPTSYKRLYLKTINQDGGSQNIPMLKTRSNTHPNQLFRIPTSITTTNQLFTVNLPQVVNDFFNISDPTLTVKRPKLSNNRSFFIGNETVNFPTVPVPQFSESQTSGAVKIFEIPTSFDVNFTSQSLSNILDQLNCTISLGWKGMDLGIVVTKNNKNKFTPFRNMFL